MSITVNYEQQSGKISELYDHYKRFQMDLEFVQLLSDPFYLHNLANKGYLHDINFINYLQHLQYWKKPEYMVFIKYPMCLKMLDCLSSPIFREQLKVINQNRKLRQQEFIQHLDDQLYGSLFCLHMVGSKKVFI